MKVMCVLCAAPCGVVARALTHSCTSTIDSAVSSCTLCAAAGVCLQDILAAGSHATDASGNAILADVGLWMRDECKKHFKVRVLCDVGGRGVGSLTGLWQLCLALWCWGLAWARRDGGVCLGMPCSVPPSLPSPPHCLPALRLSVYRPTCLYAGLLAHPIPCLAGLQPCPLACLRPCLAAERGGREVH